MRVGYTRSEVRWSTSESKRQKRNPMRVSFLARSELRALWLLLLVIVLWGVNWPVMKYGLQFIPPLTFATFRMLLGAASLFLLVAVRGQLRLPARADWFLVFSVGLLQMAGFLGLVTVALQFVPAGRSAILAYTTALWVVPLAVIWLGEPFGRYKRIGCVLGVLGVAVLFNPLAFDWSDSSVVIGNGLLLLAALLWALLIVQVRGYRMQGSPLTLAPWQFLVATLALTPPALLMEADQAIRWTPELLLILVYNGPLATAFAFWAMISVTRMLPAITTSLGSLGVPACGMLASALWLKEPLTLTLLAGVVLIGAGLTLVVLDEQGASVTADRDH